MTQVTQKRARLEELQQAINILRQQEQLQDPPQQQSAGQTHYYQQLLEQQQAPLMNEAQPQPLSLGIIDNKCVLADDLQLAPWSS
jgi:hypothetical protein